MINWVPDEHENELRLDPNTVPKESECCQLTREDGMVIKTPIHDVLIYLEIDTASII